MECDGVWYEMVVGDCFYMIFVYGIVFENFILLFCCYVVIFRKN